MKMKLLLCMGLLIGGISMSFFFAENTYAETPPTSALNNIRLFAADEPADFSQTDNGGGGDFSGGTSGNFNSSCELGGIGWIICPLATEVSKIVDAAYGFVARLLTVAPLMTTGQSANIYSAWEIMRNFANVAFVIAFMLIIFSQLTSVGLNNYGIKKMLPRLIVAAILVNVSYWICAIAVDISNILGASLNGLFQGLATGEGTTAALPTGKNAAVIGGASVGGWVGITALVLAGSAALLYIGLSALLPALLAVVVAILTILLVLTVRQALIVLLIVISPLAFVAYLLPNTESLFKKWMALFKTLLLMYPIIAMIFGASALASSILLATPASTTDDPNESAYQIAMQIMGALVAIIPLALTPIIMKTAGSVLNRVGAFVNNPNKGPFDRMRKGAEGYRQNRQEYRRLKAMNGYRTLPGKGMFSRGKAAREAVLNNRKSELNRANAEYVSSRAESSEGFRTKLAQGGGEGAEMRAEAAAINVRAELESKEIKAASAVIEHMNLDSSQVKELAKGGTVGKLSGNDAATRSAAIMSGISTGTVADVEDIIKSSGSMSETQRKTLSSAVASSGIANKATHLGGQTIDDIAQGKITTEDDLNMAAARAIEGGKYSAEKLADNDKASLQRLQKVIGQVRNDVSPQKIGQLQNQAHQVLNDQRILGRITDAQQPLLESMQAAPIEPPQAPPAQQAAAQQPDVLNIPHNNNPTTGRTSAPAGSGRATILTPPDQNNDRP